MNLAQAFADSLVANAADADPAVQRQVLTLATDIRAGLWNIDLPWLQCPHPSPDAPLSTRQMSALLPLAPRLTHTHDMYADTDTADEITPLDIQRDSHFYLNNRYVNVGQSPDGYNLINPSHIHPDELDATWSEDRLYFLQHLALSERIRPAADCERAILPAIPSNHQWFVAVTLVNDGRSCHREWILGSLASEVMPKTSPPNP